MAIGSMATAAGVIRDSDGQWVGGFVHNIGHCTVPKAELWGILGGLSLAWDRGFRKVILESDSQLVVNMLSKPIATCHPLSSLVLQYNGFLRWNWSIQIHHVFREANFVADSLATFAFSFPIGFHVLFDPLEANFLIVTKNPIGSWHTIIATIG